MFYLPARSFPIVHHRHNYRSDCTIPDAIHQKCSHDMYYHQTQTGYNSSLHSLSYDCNLSERNNELLLQKSDNLADTFSSFSV